jgi:3-isopropylmalate/(R)-2-methylmalate dehydratase small subunit
MLAIELPAGFVDHLYVVYADRCSSIDINLDLAVLTIRSAGGDEPVPFTISDFDRAMVTAGGWLEYADDKH